MIDIKREIANFYPFWVLVHISPIIPHILMKFGRSIDPGTFQPLTKIQLKRAPFV